MQDRIITAFRKRLKKRGYTEIHIRKYYNPLKPEEKDIYQIEAREPLANKNIIVYYSIIQMNNLMK